MSLILISFLAIYNQKIERCWEIMKVMKNMILNEKINRGIIYFAHNFDE